MNRLVIIIILLGVCIYGSSNRRFNIAVWNAGECAESDYEKAVLHCFLPDSSNGKAIIACPGGAYKYLCMSYEGEDFASIFNDEGISLFVLEYRLPEGRKTVPLNDALQAMRIVRSKSKEWNIDKIGIMGSSAGGHLASTLATHYVDSITRPDFQVLLYPVVTMQDDCTHSLSSECLLGKNANNDDKDLFSNEKHVTKDTPHAFIVLSSADKIVNTRNSFQYAQALIDHNVGVDIHVYEGGFHGFGCQQNYKEYNQWIGELLYWLNRK